ncbi:hypothetical protein [Thalassospira alkalitolerans]|uniref:hypothetical protein n=1 Tax=Thalassospira alkalitolerans TaxID=1293890 RepID=UPI003AA878D9
MNVFGLKFLEPMQSDGELIAVKWSWTPEGENASRIYASGNSTRSRESTYAAEKDNRQDEDRPNEGLAA